MFLKTTLSEIDEFLYKYSDLLGWADGDEVQEAENCLIGIASYRILIPKLNLSVRLGDLCSKHGGSYYEYHNPTTGEHIVEETPPPEDAEWEVDASVTILCELDEKDPKKYLGWSTDGITGTLYDYLRPKYSSLSELDEIECLIDTADFMEDEEKAQEYAKECEDNYEPEDY